MNCCCALLFVVLERKSFEKGYQVHTYVDLGCGLVGGQTLAADSTAALSLLGATGWTTLRYLEPVGPWVLSRSGPQGRLLLLLGW